MAKMYYEADADLSLIKDKTIGISATAARGTPTPLTFTTAG